jgi:hypothetical protein
MRHRASGCLPRLLQASSSLNDRKRPPLLRRHYQGALTGRRAADSSQEMAVARMQRHALLEPTAKRPNKASFVGADINSNVSVRERAEQRPQFRAMINVSRFNSTVDETPLRCQAHRITALAARTAMGALMCRSASCTVDLDAVELAQSRRARALARKAAQPLPSRLASISVSRCEERSCRAHHGHFDRLSYPSTAERCCGRRPPSAICASPGIRGIASDSHISAALAPSRSAINSSSKQNCACNCHRPSTTLRMPQRNLAQI